MNQIIEEESKEELKESMHLNVPPKKKKNNAFSTQLDQNKIVQNI